MKCRHCNKACIKKGKTLNHQRYRCTICLKFQQGSYSYQSHLVKDIELINLVKEGVGISIRGSARLLHISNSTVINRILKIARNLKRKSPVTLGNKYQVDELFTYVGNKKNRVCVAYSLNVDTKEVVGIVVGKRNKTNLMRVISTLLLANSKQITTDKLNIYKELIPKEIHSTKNRGINHIERQNLTLRTHLKRLNRKTICYSKSLAMLLAIVKIYFWI